MRILALAALACLAGAGLVAVARPLPVGATQSITITDGTTLLGLGLGARACGSVQASYCFSPTSISASTGETIVWVNNSSIDQVLTGHGASTSDSVSLAIPRGGSNHASFPLAGRVSFNVNGGEGGTIDVSGPPVTSGSGSGSTGTGGTGPGTAQPNTVTGAGAAKPNVVSAPQGTGHAVITGPRGSTALPPVNASDPNAAASPAADVGSLPPIVVPTPKPKTATLAGSTSNGLFNKLGQRQTLYLIGAALFALIVIVSTIVYLVRRHGHRKAELVPL